MQNKHMMDIPFEKNPGEACALACYTMTARYFFPKTTFDQIAKISNWTPGYIVWAFKFWLWILNEGIKVTNYDLISLESWADEGIEGLKKTISEQEFDFYVNHTKDINIYSDDIKRVLAHPNFTHNQKKPTWSDLVDAFSRGAVCEIVLDSATLDKEESFSLHRVVVLDIDKDYIIFHDPRSGRPRPGRKERIKEFKKAWLERLEAPELCTYKKL